jgi:2-methylcitrate dehydratase PrpD
MAEFAVNLKYEDIPARARHEAKRFLLDSVGCALAAVRDMGRHARGHRHRHRPSHQRA